MKKIIFILMFSVIACEVDAQDTASLKYFPLKAGNTWVYSCSSVGYGCFCDLRKRTKAVQKIQKYGKYYFVFSTQTFVIQTCNGGCPWQVIPFDTLRIDSSTCKIYKFSENGDCPNSLHEVLYDSLLAKYGDTTYIKCHTDWRICQDTETVNLFGAQRKSKFFLALYFENAYSERFVKNLGLTYAHSEGINCSSDMNLHGCVIDGVVYGDTAFPVGVNIISTEVPKEFSLSQNFPNPFNPSTKIKFAVSFSPLGGPNISAPGRGNGENVKLIVYDVLGKEIAVLVNERLKPGVYEAEWDAAGYPSGIYFYSIFAENYSETKKMALVK